MSKSKSTKTGDGTLYVVATPIGNLADWTFRAVDIAKRADVIACEDTRVTGKLLHHYGIGTRMMAYHEHNAAEMRPKLIAMLEEGKQVALMSDAGTPLISDPGYKLITALRERGLRIEVIPGASSVTAALSVAGLPTDQFFFAGFAPNKAQARKAWLEELAPIPGTWVLFESAKRLAKTLADIAVIYPARQVAVARELTKIYEEVVHGTAAELAAAMEADPLRGEIVLLVAPGGEGDHAPDEEALKAMLKTLLETHSTKEAVAILTEQSGLPRKKVYAWALALT